MSYSYPGSELTIEQLIHALAQALDPNSPSGRTLLESEPQKIFDIERDLYDILRATKTIRNACVPVNRLPPEILSRILEFRTSERVLVTTTHVCRHWRYTLTSSPSLWTCFMFRMSMQDIGRTLTYLERSKSAPIDIRIDMNSPRGFKVLKYLAPHVARMRSLTLLGNHTEIRAASLLLCTPSPILQHLRICANNGLVHLPDDFLGRQTPSLRSLSFEGIHPAFESHSPLLNLIEFMLSLPKGTSPLRVGALFQFLSGCPSLQKICVNSQETSQDITLDQIISLESLVELEYACNPVGRILPCLRLPRLERLQVSFQFRSGQEQRLADLLPHGGHVLLAGATKMLYGSYESSQEVKFLGKGTDVSFNMLPPAIGHAPFDRFLDEMCIPFGQIEGLTVQGSTDVDFPVNVAILRNLKVLRISPSYADSKFTERFLDLLYPRPETGVPCQSLQEIQYTHLGISGSLPPLIGLVTERKQVGHQLGLVRLLLPAKCKINWRLVKKLKERVGKVKLQSRDVLPSLD